MKPEAQRIAIAEACPQIAFIKSDGCPYWKDRRVPVYDEDRLTHEEFDPLTDLNAMHEAEKVLTDGQRIKYGDELAKFYQTDKWCVWWAIIPATAAQRAEAFLRTIGKWEEDK